jgi:hypothetical protein
MDITRDIPITIDAEYLPIISVNPLGQLQEVSPGEIATFDIEIENQGNAKTEVKFNVLDPPEGWSVTIPSSTKLESKLYGGNPKKIVKLLVQPPYGFGYHNERVDIRVEIFGYFFADESLKGPTYIETFTIRNRGFSTPGFEAVFLVFALIGITFIVKKRQKNAK